MRKPKPTQGCSANERRTFVWVNETLKKYLS
jgi:hypothetical protein